MGMRENKKKKKMNSDKLCSLPSAVSYIIHDCYSRSRLRALPIVPNYYVNIDKIVQDDLITIRTS